jgi:hypothetical protein
VTAQEPKKNHGEYTFELVDSLRVRAQQERIYVCGAKIQPNKFAHNIA